MKPKIKLLAKDREKVHQKVGEKENFDYLSLTHNNFRNIEYRQRGMVEIRVCILISNKVES